MMSLAEPPRKPEALPLIDAASVPDRDSFIRHLVNTCGWATCKVADHFGLSRRRIREITEHRPPLTPVNTPDPTPLSAEEKQAMLDEYARDPESRMLVKTLRLWLDGEPEAN